MVGLLDSHDASLLPREIHTDQIKFSSGLKFVGKCGLCLTACHETFPDAARDVPLCDPVSKQTTPLVPRYCRRDDHLSKMATEEFSPNYSLLSHSTSQARKPHTPWGG